MSRGVRIGVAATALVALAACGKKSEPGAGGGPGTTTPPPPPPAEALHLEALPLAAAGDAFAAMSVDAPAGATVKGAKGDAMVAWADSVVQVTTLAPTIAVSKQEYASVAAQIQATVTFTKETDTAFEYTIERGPQREHGLEMRIDVGGVVWRCFMPLSTQDPAVRDVARAICGSLRGTAATPAAAPAAPVAAPMP